jgi:hypothetical protein
MTRVLHRILLTLLAPTVLVACGPPGDHARARRFTQINAL